MKIVDSMVNVHKKICVYCFWVIKMLKHNNLKYYNLAHDRNYTRI